MPQQIDSNERKDTARPKFKIDEYHSASYLKCKEFVKSQKKLTEKRTINHINKNKNKTM